MKKVRLITADENNGKLAISRTPLRNKFFFEGAWHDANMTIKPEIIKDASILETTHAVYAELTDTFDISNLVKSVEIAMWDHKRRPRPATIDRRVRELKELNLINYEVVNSAKDIYRKLPVVSCEQKKIEFKTDVEKRFIEFLKAEGAYEKFEKNKETMPMFESTAPCKENMLSCQFAWTNSPEGHKYWSDIDDKWREICKTL